MYASAVETFCNPCDMYILLCMCVERSDLEHFCFGNLEIHKL